MPVRIMWFRRDLRLADNAALTASAQGDSAVIPAFVLDPAEQPAADAVDEWLRLSLAELDEALRESGNHLNVLRGPAPAALLRLARETQAISVHCTRDWTPCGLAQENEAARVLSDAGVRLVVSEGQLLVPPGALQAPSGGAYRVFTPFYRRWATSAMPVEPLPAPTALRAAHPALVPADSAGGAAVPVDALRHADAPDIAAWWTPGEAAALARLDEFVSAHVHEYPALHDIPAVRGTSELSPRLAFGELSPNQVLWALRGHGDAGETFVRQMAWREFAYHTLHANPDMTHRPLDRRFEAFPWSDDEGAFEAWTQGRTGFPLVDAGMRQLATTGWMHNRVRMVCASFLTKDLLVPWQRGAAHFHARLVDYDPALNTFNWQWVAGCGADAAPYFRIFNPETQRRRFDPDGAYAERWAPDSAGLEPIVDHAEARRRALAAYQAVRLG